MVIRFTASIAVKKLLVIVLDNLIGKGNVLLVGCVRAIDSDAEEVFVDTCGTVIGF